MLEREVEACQYLLVTLLDKWLDFIRQQSGAPSSQHSFCEVGVDRAVFELTPVVSDRLLCGILFEIHDVVKEVLHLLSQLRIEFFDICPSFTDLLNVLSAHGII